jgi:hypothetical protein
MKALEFLELITRELNRLGIPYLVTGSMASISYGEARFTADVDIVIRVEPPSARRLVEAFDDERFYVSLDAALDAVRRGGQFNVIHNESSFKADFIVAKQEEFDESRFARARTITMDSGAEVRFASPEDVIIRKLQYYKEGGSDKHLRDIDGILKTTEVDDAYIEHWARQFDVEDEWRRARSS